MEILPANRKPRAIPIAGAAHDLVSKIRGAFIHARGARLLGWKDPRSSYHASHYRKLYGHERARPGPAIAGIARPAEKYLAYFRQFHGLLCRHSRIENGRCHLQY